MRTLIEDEENRPVDGKYVWAHIYLPHAPYNLNSNCEYQLNSITADQTDGINVFSDELQKDRTIDVFSGFVQIT